MATIARTIYSNYDPNDRHLLEIETGQVALPEEDEAVQWTAESEAAFPHRLGPAPRFVPATLAYDPWSAPQNDVSTVTESSENAPDVAAWYRSLTKGPDASHPKPSSSSNLPDSKPTPQSLPPAPKRSQKPTKNDWFIMNALKSQEQPAPSSSSSTTLADILARDPPPLRGSFNPPVWLTLGPSNKGFEMLEKSGWNEGEALGPDIVRRGRSKGKRKAVDNLELPTKVEVKVGKDDDIWELRPTIDLTLSDSDQETAESATRKPAAVLPSLSNDSDTPYARKALLTPLTTVLKSDRLGIGLKAKTTGPYKESQKRVTHSAKAVAAHLKAAEDLKRWQASHGRGHKSYKRRQQEEEERRKALLAYMNT
ncbi:hypothetical protein C8J56DRAFT_999845 [Mycena floridula]|nr:hypothetical protein C8J56DRAFT_999845 [Mycena floridula]